MLDIIQFHFAVAAAKRRFDLIQKKYPGLKARLLLSQPGEQTGIDSSPAQIFRECPALVSPHARLKNYMLETVSQLEELESASDASPEIDELRSDLEFLARASRFEENGQVEIYFDDPHNDLIEKLRADDLVGSHLPPNASGRMVLATLAQFLQLQPTPSELTLFVDLGRRTSEIVVHSIREFVCSRSLHVGGDDFNEDIVAHVKNVHGLTIDERTAEEIKLTIGSAIPLEQELTMSITGRPANDAPPEHRIISSEEIRVAFREGSLAHLLESIHLAIQHSPEFSAGLNSAGLKIGSVVLTGGGAVLRGVDRLIATETGLPVRMADNPKTFRFHFFC